MMAKVSLLFFFTLFRQRWNTNHPLPAQLRYTPQPLLAQHGSHTRTTPGQRPRTPPSPTPLHAQQCQHSHLPRRCGPLSTRTLRAQTGRCNRSLPMTHWQCCRDLVPPSPLTTSWNPPTPIHRRRRRRVTPMPASYHHDCEMARVQPAKQLTRYAAKAKLIDDKNKCSNLPRIGGQTTPASAPSRSDHKYLCRTATACAPPASHSNIPRRLPCFNTPQADARLTPGSLGLLHR